MEKIVSNLDRSGIADMCDMFHACRAEIIGNNILKGDVKNV